MKIRTRRLLSLLLALLMVLTLAPTAFMEGEGGDDGGEPGETPGEGEERPVNVTEFTLQDDQGVLIGSGDSYSLTLEPDTSSAGGVRIKTRLEPDVQAIRKMHVAWKSDDTSVAAVSEQPEDGQYGAGHVANVVGKAPGTTTITATADNLSCKIAVEVSGIKLSDELTSGLSLAEYEIRTLVEGKDYFFFGRAKTADGKISASEVNNKTIISVSGSAAQNSVTIEGRQAGTGTVRLRLPAGGRVYEVEFPVTVTSSVSVIPWTAGVSPSNPLKFSDLEGLIAAECQTVLGERLVSVTDLSVPTAQGIIYQGYQGPDHTGAGVGSSQTYYASGQPRGPYIKDLTFVPNQSYTGEKATISFTGTAANARAFKGKIEVTLEDVHTDVILTTRADVPLKLSAENFTRVCQEQTGSPLSYVVFTLPPVSEGVLYRDYKNAMDYGARVTASEKYDRKGLDDVTFVPAQGFVGTVTIGYAGYSTTGSKYIGQLVIQVKQGLNDAITYIDGGAGEVPFYRWDFENFCENATGRELSGVSFSLPPASQGTLYYNWNGVRGAAVEEGSPYGPAQIDRLTFVAADGFDGVVRIPFSGTDRNGAEFSGTVEIHIQTSGSGDISYICAPGQSVKLLLSDFANFCQSLTGQRLHYITFPSLPDFNQGALYHNRTSGGGMGTRVTTSTKYFNSATPYIANLSFWAAESFRGSLEIPFTGCAVSGESFSGVLFISSGAGNGSGSSTAVRYSVVGQGSVRFAGGDFDAVCRQATNTALSYLRFDLPSSGQGILYYDQRAGSNPTALAPSATLYRSGEVSVDRVSFVPARGFSGIVSVPFTGWAIDGREFRGVVEITVRAAAALGGLVRYETGGTPVRVNAYDVQIASGGQPASLRLTGLPDASQGRLYYQYVSPTRYSWQGNTSTIYSMSGDPSVSNLTFIPRAGYYGTVEIPYAAANLDGSSYTGVIRITVTAPELSASFDDLAGYSAQTKAAVDYLASQGVVNGTAPRTYEPGASIRRGDFCLMLSRAFRFDVGSAARGFTDVPADAYYAQAVNEMYALGVVNGVGGGRFQPSATISRQDAALMVQRALKQAGIDVPDGNAAALASYSDRGEVADYARGAVSGLAQRGLLPTGSDSISPKADLTRADMALLLHRAMTQ